MNKQQDIDIETSIRPSQRQLRRRKKQTKINSSGPGSRSEPSPSERWSGGAEGSVGDVGGAVLMGDVDAVLAELDHESEGAKLDLVVLVDEADEALLGFSPSALAEEALTGAGC